MKYNYTPENLEEIVKESVSFSEVLRKLNIPIQGNNSKTLKNILINKNISFSHFTGRAKSYNSSYINVSEYLIKNSSISSSALKDKLLKEHIKTNRCENCGISEWLGKPIVIQLHHINGDSSDNQLENLQLLCPNCHSQTDNYCGNKEHKESKICPDCGKIIHNNSTYCTTCSIKYRRKVERPEKDEFLNKFLELKNFTSVGSFYGVSDNTIRKWCKFFEIPNSKKELNDYLSSQTKFESLWDNLLGGQMVSFFRIRILVLNKIIVKLKIKHYVSTYRF